MRFRFFVFCLPAAIGEAVVVVVEEPLSSAEAAQEMGMGFILRSLRWFSEIEVEVGVGVRSL